MLNMFFSCCNRDLLASDILKEEPLGNLEETTFEDCKGSEHQGQGDGPPPAPSLETTH